MTKKLRIVLAQLNLSVGNIQANLNKLMHAAIFARDQLTASVIVFPELSITGYPPEDLLFRPHFINSAEQALSQFKKAIDGIYCLVGHPAMTVYGLQNTCSLIYNGKVLASYAKQILPNYGVFDECRYFVAGQTSSVVEIEGITCALIICEDLWHPAPIQQAVACGAQLILAPNASPFAIDKHARRLQVLSKRASEHHLPIFYVNQVGGQDELIFDGDSMVVNAAGEVSQSAGFYHEKLLPVDIEVNHTQIVIASNQPNLPTSLDMIYQGLQLSLRDYVEKNESHGVVIGVSGGIDSALTLALAVDALGQNRVQAVFMPSRFSAAISQEDAEAVAQNLGVSLTTISIEPMYQAFLQALAPSFAQSKSGVTEENIQSRIRAILLMALANKTGKLVLTTGNRSELAVGYCTIYGDMAGGFAPLKNVSKTMVYELAHYRNQQALVIPLRTISRPPTAELALDQKDEDSLPAYTILDPILAAYLDQSLGVDEIVKQGFERETVKRVVQLIHRSEHKRHQAAIGPHLAAKSFGKDWRYPVCNGFNID